MGIRKGWGRSAVSVMSGLALVGALGCSSDAGDATSGSSATCGEGTVEKSGVCTPTASTGVSCGTGTREVAGNCVVDETPTTGAECGVGTIEKDGVCELDPNAVNTLACGDGTIEIDGVCEPDRLTVEGFAITAFDIDLPEGGKAQANYPVTLTVSTRADTPFNSHMTVGLTNYTDDMADDDIESCIIGGFQLQHPGGGEVVETVATLFVSSDCLFEVSSTEGRITGFPTLSFADEGVAPADSDLSAIRFAAGESAIAGCASASAQSDGSCGYAIEITAPSGIDIELTSARSESSVIVLQAVPDSVVKTPTGDLIYGAPELKMNVEVTAFGASVLDEDGNPLNVLGEEDVTVTYAIRPTDAEESETWQPIFLHEEGDAAKADEDVTVANLDSAVETEIFAQAPHYFDHGLYIEDDCGTRCGASICPFNDTCSAGGYCTLDPAAGECDGSAVARTWIMDGQWKQYDHFTVRACLTSAAEGTSFDENNCVFEQVLIVRLDNTADAATDGSGGGNLDTVPLPDKSFTKAWSNSVGGSALQLNFGVSSETAARLWTPAVGTANDAWVGMSSSYVGSADVVRGWLHGHVNAAQGWAYDVGLSAFGQTLWNPNGGDSDAASYAYNFEESREWSRSKGWSFNFMAGPVPLNVEFGFEGTVYLNAGFDVTAGFTETDAYANLDPYITPGAALSGYAKAGVSIGWARAGVGVDLSIMDGSLPLTFGAGITADPVNKKEVTGSAYANLSLSLSTLYGNLFAYAEKQKLKCKKGKPWTCKLKWSTFWKQNVFSFAGYTWSYPIFTQEWSSTQALD